MPPPAAPAPRLAHRNAQTVVCCWLAAGWPLLTMVDLLLLLFSAAVLCWLLFSAAVLCCVLHLRIVSSSPHLRVRELGSLFS